MPNNHAKQSTRDAFKTASKRAIQNTVEETVDLICNKVANKIIKVWKILQQNNTVTNNSVTVKNEHDKEILKERYISPEESQKIIDGMRLM